MKNQLSKFLGMSINEQKNDEIRELHIDSVLPNPYQPRKIFDSAQLEELASSIKEYGIIQPIVVRKIGNDFELIAGERRLRASKLAGKVSIPAIIKNFSDKEAAELALIENLQREDLNYFEEAEGFIRLMKDFNLTQDEIAKRVGKSQSTIANKLRILKLPEEVRASISTDVITERHARALLKLISKEQQLLVLKEIYERELNVRQTDEFVDQIINGDPDKVEKEKAKRKFIIRDIRILLNSIKSAVKTVNDAGFGAKILEKDLDDHIELTIKIPKQKKN